MGSQFGWKAICFVYTLVLAALINIMVWVAATLLIAFVWSRPAAWGPLSHYMVAWLMTFQIGLFVRGLVRKATTILEDRIKPEGVVPLLPMGMTFDLVIWNGAQLIFACKLLGLNYEASRLADVLN